MGSIFYCNKIRKEKAAVASLGSSKLQFLESMHKALCSQIVTQAISQYSYQMPVIFSDTYTINK